MCFEGGFCVWEKFVVWAFVICHIIIALASSRIGHCHRIYLPVCWPYIICIVLLYTMRLRKRDGCGTTLSDSLESK
jgi:hypothetical protein